MNHFDSKTKYHKHGVGTFQNMSILKILFDNEGARGENFLVIKHEFLG